MMKLELLPYFYAFSMWIIIISASIILAKLFKIKIKNFIFFKFCIVNNFVNIQYLIAARIKKSNTN